MNKFRFLTAGESHGKCLTAIIEGVPAGFDIKPELINEDLKRRQSGYGRGERMKIEADTVEITSGVRFGKTLGSPITLVIQNKDFENWQKIMSVNPEDYTDEKSFTKCRPGHADYAGSIKYNQKDLRNILERSSARKTAIEVAVGSIAKQILSQFDIKCSSKILQIGKTEDKKVRGLEGKLFNDSNLNEILQKQQNDNSLSSYPPTFQPSENNFSTNDIFHPEIDRVKALGDTIGGKFEVVFENLPVGLGSFVHWDRMLDGKIAQAVMSIPAVKALEIGENPLRYLGSEYHDEMFIEDGKIIRKTNNAGGIEGGMTNGEPLIVRAVMKPIPTMKKPLKTVDLATLEECEAHFERSDVCAVEACSVVAEARIACVLADEFLQKFAGDNLEEIVSRY